MRNVAIGVSILLLTVACVIWTRLELERRDAYQIASLLTSGKPELGRTKLREYGCSSCHTIPGVSGAYSTAAPPLTKFALRMYIAGELENTPDNLRRWIQHPRAIEPHTAMPELGVTDKDSCDMAAYLYTLR